MKSEVVPRMKTLFTWLSPYLTVRNKFEVGTATSRFEFGVACDHAVERLGVFGLDLFAVAIIPPVVHLFPRPLVDIENIVAEDGHAFVEADWKCR